MKPKRHNINKPFLLAIEGIFSIEGRGTIVTGNVARGTLHKGQELDIVGLRHEIAKKTVTGIEMFNKEFESIKTGDNAGILLHNITRDEVQRGMVLAQVGSIKPHKKFKCEVTMLRFRDEGGHKAFFAEYCPRFYFRTVYATGTINFLDDIEMVMPGDSVNLVVALTAPIALERGTFFVIVESTTSVATGLVTQILD